MLRPLLQFRRMNSQVKKSVEQGTDRLNNINRHVIAALPEDHTEARRMASCAVQLYSNCPPHGLQPHLQHCVHVWERRNGGALHHVYHHHACQAADACRTGPTEAVKSCNSKRRAGFVFAIPGSRPSWCDTSPPPSHLLLTC